MELLCCTRSKLSPAARREQPGQRTRVSRVVLYLLWLSVPALHHECLHPVELHLLGLPQDRPDPFGQFLGNLQLVVAQHRPLAGQQLVQHHPIGEHVHLEPGTEGKIRARLCCWEERRARKATVTKPVPPPMHGQRTEPRGSASPPLPPRGCPRATPSHLLVVDNAGPDLGGLVARGALHAQRALVERLPRDSVVRELDVDVLPDVQGPHQDVVRLEVAEDDVLLVQVGQARGDLVGHFVCQHVSQRHKGGPWHKGTARLQLL